MIEYSLEAGNAKRFDVIAHCGELRESREVVVVSQNGDLVTVLDTSFPFRKAT